MVRPRQGGPGSTYFLELLDGNALFNWFKERDSKTVSVDIGKLPKYKELDFVFVKDIEVFNNCDFVFIPEDRNVGSGEAYGYSSDGIGSIEPATDNWKPTGNLEFIDGFYNGNSYYCRIRSEAKNQWESFSSINLRARAADGEEINVYNLVYGNGYNSSGTDQAREWFYFVKAKQGIKISVWIEEVI